MKTELDRFYGLINEIKVAMMTTRRRDGHLESRAMANQKRADGADLWFVTTEGSDKLRDIEYDPHVNLAYYKPGSYEWVSASGIASVSRDRSKVRELFEPDWTVCAVFLEVNKPKPVILFELAKGWLTGARVEPGETHELQAPHR